MEHDRIRFDETEFILRDVEERDVPAIVSYWHDSPPEYLRSIGLDVGRLPSREEMAKRLRAMATSGGLARRATLVCESGGRPVGVGTLRTGMEKKQGYAHTHILDDALRGRGLGHLLLVPVFGAWFRSFPVDEIIAQVVPENARVNRALQKSGLVPTKVELENPGGMMRPGAFNVYTIPRVLIEGLWSSRAHDRIKEGTCVFPA